MNDLATTIRTLRELQVKAHFPPWAVKEHTVEAKHGPIKGLEIETAWEHGQLQARAPITPMWMFLKPDGTAGYHVGLAEVDAALIVAAINALPDLLYALEATTEDLRQERAGRDSACKTVADMHAAAVGEVRGPIRGVVEDVADLRAERDQWIRQCGVEVAAAHRMEQERDEAQKKYQFMVDHAADEKLDGYRELGARAAKAENERDKLQAFKVFVHARLDQAGVPVDPPGKHRDEGCRVGQRLDWLVNSITASGYVAEIRAKRMESAIRKYIAADGSEPSSDLMEAVNPSISGATNG